MAATEQIVWGIHGGKTGDADNLFLEHGVVGLGWEAIGDLSKLPPDREAFKSAVLQAYPEKKPGAIPVDAGQLYRFVHEMQVDDLVAYPSKMDKLVHLGAVGGAYAYFLSGESGYPDQRRVQWVNAIPRTHFSQGALYEIGAAMSFFQVKNYADEFRAAAEGKAATARLSFSMSVISSPSTFVTFARLISSITSR